jgi:hypothetical protein
MGFSASFVKVYFNTEGQITPLDLPNSFINELMILRAAQVVQLSTRRYTKVVSEGDVVSDAQLGRLIVGTLTHLGHLNLCQEVFLDAAWSLQGEDIIIDVCKAVKTVFKRQG